MLEGNDPYDALRGWRVPGFVYRSARLRQLAIQVRRRSPADLAPLYGVAPFTMAKAVACFLSGHARRSFASGVDDASVRTAEALIEAMYSAEGCLGEGAWGYEFDVQTRWAYYAAGSPNLIATTFVGTSLLEAGLAFAREEWVAGALESAKWIQKNLLGKVEGSRTPVYRYTPDTARFVHNANLLGAAFVASGGSVVGDEGLIQVALEAAEASVGAQEESGRWAYGVGGGLGWADNFHTAYNLGGLLQLSVVSPGLFADSVQKGTRYWIEGFFGPNGEPHYYDDRAYPLDIHSGATAVDVLARLELHGIDVDGITDRCARWVRENLVEANGKTAYQVHRLWTDRRSFVRWGDGHWAAALGTLALRDANSEYPCWSRRHDR